MAIFKIEVEIENIGEDYTLDEEIINDIISRISSKVTAQLSDEIRIKAAEKIEEAADKMITDILKSKLEEFITEPRDITDNYGRVTESGVTIEDKFIKAMEGALKEKTLDDNGNIPAYRSTGASMTIFEWATKDRMEKIVSKEIKKISVITHEEEKQIVADQYKASLAGDLSDFIVNHKGIMAKLTKS